MDPLTLFSFVPRIGIFVLIATVAVFAVFLLKFLRKQNNSATTSAASPPSPVKSPDPLKNKKIILSAVIAVFLLAGLVGGVVLVRNRQETRGKAEGPNPISAVCTADNSRGLLVVHYFNSQGTCENCARDPNCVSQLVEQPSDPNVCPAGNNYLGTTTNPYDGQRTVCSDLGVCSGKVCSSTYPNCAAVQIDCLTGLGGSINAGAKQINCICNTPPQPSPTPTPTTTIPTPTPSPTPTTVTPTPVYQCDSVCSTSSQCPSGLICNASRCRNAGCVDRNNCVCVTPTPTTSPVCNSPCSSTSQCPSGMTCSLGFCRNPSCVSQSNCVCNVVTVTPPPVPVSGWEVPTAAVSLGGVVLLFVAKLLL